MKIGKRQWVLFCTLIFASGLSLCWLFGSLMVLPDRAVPEIFAETEQRIQLKTADGVNIAGTFLPAKTDRAPGVLLLHGVKSSRNQYVSQAQWLNERGYAVLAIDFRGHGQSDPVSKSFGLFESEDAGAAFRWLKNRQQGAPVAIVGTSLGGAAALLGKNGPLPADAMVLQAVYPDIRAAIRNRLSKYLGNWIGAIGEPFLSFQSRLRFGVWPDQISPIRAISRYKGKLLIIGGEKDIYTPPSETRALFVAAKTAKSVWIIPKLGHEAVGTDGEEQRNRLGWFLDSAFKPRQP